MTTQLNFTEEFTYKDDLSGISIPVTLTYGGNSLRVSAKVDTGAEVCLFSHEDGVDLGVPVERGLPLTLNSLGGSVQAFGHEVTIQTGELVFHSTVYFAKHPNLPRNILGRRGWLRQLKLAVVDYDSRLLLAAYDG